MSANSFVLHRWRDGDALAGGANISRRSLLILARMKVNQLTFTIALMSGHKYDYPLMSRARLRQIIRRNPNDAIAYHYLATCESGKQALAYYDRSLELDPNYAFGYCHRGNEKISSNNDIEGAMADYNRAIELDPNQSFFYTCRSILKLQFLNDVEGAKADCRKAVEINQSPEKQAEYQKSLAESIEEGEEYFYHLNRDKISDSPLSILLE
jgi:tetratricopeptide (TPR) repeat protein